jgi:hypothetical protein
MLLRSPALHPGVSREEKQTWEQTPCGLRVREKNPKLIGPQVEKGLAGFFVTGHWSLVTCKRVFCK